MQFTRPASEVAGGSWIISDENDEINIAYTKANCQGYLLEKNIYEKLVYLAGYKNIQKVESKEESFSTIKDIISKKYGQKETDEFYKAINDLYSEYNNSWQGEEVYNLSVKVENLFLDFIKQDIKNLKTEKEIKEYMRIYEFYKIKNIPEVRNNATGEQITIGFWGINTIDELLNNKLQKVNKENEKILY